MNISSLQLGYKRYALYERELMPRTVKEILKSVERLQSYTNSDELKQYSYPAIKAYLYHQKETRLWSAKTFRNQRQYLKSFFAWCEKEGYIKINPVDKIEKPKLPVNLPRFKTKEEILTILAHAEYYPWRSELERVRNVSVIATYVLAGLRLNELLSVQKIDVSLKTREIIVKKGKGRKERIVPIHPRLYSILLRLENYCKEHGIVSIWYFPSGKKNAKLCEKTVHRLCDKVSVASGIKFTPHVLRHSFGRSCINADVGLYNTKELMGHSSVSTTERYLSISKEQLKKTFCGADLF